MGSNIHIQRAVRHSDVTLKEWPESLGTGPNSCTLPRYVDSREFMRALWDNCEVAERCTCKPDDHDYFCDRDSVVRPKDFVKLREATSGLQPIFQELIDYLENEPNAWLEYD
jgi:hypothetical protein